MTSPKFYRNPKLDKIFDEIRPEIRAMIASQSFGQPYHEVQHNTPSFQQSQQQLLELIDHCHQQVEFYAHLGNIYRERLAEASELPSYPPCSTSKKE